MAKERSKSPAELAYSYMKEGYEQEVGRMEALDSKSSLFISILSVLIAVVVGLISLAYHDDSSMAFAGACKLRLVSGALLLLTNLSFLVAISCSMRASLVREYWSALVYQTEDIDQWAESQNTTELEVFFAKQLQAYWLHNRNENDSKAKWLRRSALFLSIGAVALALGALLVLGYLLVWLNL